MPIASVRDIEINYRLEGDGAETIVLVNGLADDLETWAPQMSDLLAAGYRVLRFDNRGIGATSKPAGPYSSRMLADDAKALVDALGITDFHLLGVSMGGMIAQEFTLQYPQRVRSLILGCTNAGGPHAVRAAAEVLQLLMRQGMTPEEAKEAIIPYIYDPATPRARIDEDMAIRMKWYPTPQGYLGQLQGILAWEAYSRIAQIKAPTLIIHGETDQLIPVANAKLIAERMPHAQLVLIPHASHIFETDQPAIANRAITEFLSAQ